MGGGIAGEHPFEIVYVCRHEDLCIGLTRMPHSNAASERTFSTGNNIIGKVFVSYSIAMAKLSYIYPGCNSFIQLEPTLLISSTVFPPLLDPISCRPTVFFTFLVVTMFLLVSILTSMHHIYVLASQSARKICEFGFGSCNEVDVICYS